MNNDEQRFDELKRATERFGQNVTRAAPVAGAGYTLIGAILLLGGIGYAIDAWRGTSPWFLVGGLLLGVAVGMWELAKVVWHK